ncbi:MAG: dihydrofolate reductase [Ornithinimicrobium sp.]
MTQQRFAVVPSVYVALVRPGDRGEEVLLQVRRGTPYMDGWWACGAAGHVEQGESVHAAAVREAREELGISIAATALKPTATVHRTCALDDPVEERMDLFFAVREWQGEPVIAEPDKAAELRWWPLHDLPENVVPHEGQALQVLASGAGPAVLSRGFGQTLTLVAAVARNGVIGDGSGLLWHLPEDLKHFKDATMGGVMVMGRRTFESIGRALPGRTSIVVTRDPGWAREGVVVAHGMAEAMLIAGDTEVFVIGGGEIYAQTIGSADRLDLTEVDQRPEGSVTFPVIDETAWVQTKRDPHEGFSFVTYHRR